MFNRAKQAQETEIESADQPGGDAGPRKVEKEPGETWSKLRGNIPIRAACFRTLSAVGSTFYFATRSSPRYAPSTTPPWGTPALQPSAISPSASTLQFFSNLVAVALADVIPRRKGLVGGGTLLMFWSIIIAGSSLAAKTNNATNWALLAFMITWSMLYTATVGCFGWAIAQETAAQATRPKTISFVLVCQQLTALMLSSVFPYFINPDQLNWGGKVMFLFVGAEIFIIGLLWLLQPETKNRTNVEIDILYAANIPARKFKDFDIIDGEVVPKQKKSGFLSRFSRKA
ncbi:unnamed protein product [Zymoseptoria tritici ST99CH_1A5]|uniref:Major facilitator superfamily (MFS) profile domain-containing protein n=1 Tax=Zymoseptoria tritici ST99CH_1A5 TaxID=1276529 RepID=A0A1Y6LCS3_ZYMTR|nr:unnamed protein product [Zymoseptoria tritici ST99CH_1A5]